ncbi:response regulator transcription factor [Abyssisolibacter fermentans]|uniref:response regulator transcription factor n=1 Tax=Abyssisolibacter fermentans TaxID=1766203 RepID=UPI000829F815|nr:helix-turn-helix domain-containing protein [Abyssisolibacter fermentans]
MYSIVIVDDEPLIAKGIERSCKWEKFGAKVDLVTSDPEEALDFIIKNRPHIVFTDINMGDFSGIELMKKARIEGVDSEFVVISGYSEFEYVRNAMKYNAFYYLLKPIDKKELASIMSNLIMNIKGKKETDSSFEFMENLLINTKITTHRELFELNNFNVEKPGFQTVVIEGNIHKKLLKNIIRDNKYLVLKIGSCKRAYFINTDRDIYSEYLIGTVKKSNVKIGISSFYDHEVSPYKSFVEGDIALCNHFIYKELNIFKYDIKKKDILTIIKPCAECFNDFDKVKPFLKNLSEYVRNNELSILEITLLYNYFSNTMEYINVTSTQGIESQHKTYEEIISSFKDMEDLAHFLYEYINNSFKEELDENDSKDNNIFDEIINYIHENYLEPLYLADIADKFFYNQTYISDLIKRNLGKNFTEYVIELRIEKACALLSSTNNSISFIAAKCGYNDYCYFSKQFKKITGKTPSAYRKE